MNKSLGKCERKEVWLLKLYYCFACKILPLVKQHGEHNWLQSHIICRCHIAAHSQFNTKEQHSKRTQRSGLLNLCSLKPFRAGIMILRHTLTLDILLIVYSDDVSESLERVQWLSPWHLKLICDV